jgi:hypothetical protein
MGSAEGQKVGGWSYTPCLFHYSIIGMLPIDLHSSLLFYMASCPHTKSAIHHRSGAKLQALLSLTFQDKKKRNIKDEPMYLINPGDYQAHFSCRITFMDLSSFQYAVHKTPSTLKSK